MFEKFIVGKFKVTVSDPAPIWITIECTGTEIRHMCHDDIDDLIYALQKAKKLSNEKLPINDRITIT